MHPIHEERSLVLALGLHSSELVYDPQFEQLVASLCLQPQMYVGTVSFAAVCAYLEGFNQARNGGPLNGLQQWLVVRLNTGNNLHWSGLAHEQLPTAPADAKLSDDERAVRGLGLLLAEFFEYRRANGVTKVFHEYARWQLRQPWYTGPLRQAKDRCSEA